MEKDIYLEVMREAGNRIGLEMVENSGDWILEFRGENNLKFDVLNYDIGLNKSIHMRKVIDKTLCYNLLEKGGVPCVEHFLFRDPLTVGKTFQNVLNEALIIFNKCEEKAVLKPNKGGAGKDVVYVDDLDNLSIELENLFNKRLDVALSNYYDYDIEYRLVVLDGEILMGFGKRKQGDDFRHNLSAGSSVTDLPIEKLEEFKKLTKDIVDIIGIRFASIDVIDHKDGLKVLEINSGVTLKRVALASEEWKEKCIESYKKALLKVVEES